MKKGLTLFAFILSLLILTGCQTPSSVKATILTVTPARTTVYFEFSVEDPNAEIQENSIVAVIYADGNELARKAPTLVDGVRTVTFEGLSVGQKYDFSIFATYNGKSNKIASGTATTSTVGGSASEPRLIQTTEDFINIKNDLTAFYRLEADLDFNNESFTNALGSNAFAGNFDGNNKTIRNVLMNKTTTNNGLFGYNRGTIKNLNIENVTVAFTTATQNVGIVAGRNSGIIENVSISNASISLTYSRTGRIHIGGVVGLSESNSRLTDITVSDLDMNLEISGRTEPMAGLVAGFAQGTRFNEVSATGTIMFSSSDSSYIGGLIGAIENVGNISSRVSNATSNVEITGSVHVITTLTNDTAQSIYVGGLIASVVGTIIENVYANADIKLTSVKNTSANDRNDDEIAVGGLIGVTSSAVNQGLATGSIKVGENEFSIVSFENLFVGGVYGIQLGNLVNKTAAYGLDIQVRTDAGLVSRISQTVGSNPNADSVFQNTTLTVNGDLETDYLHVSHTDAITITRQPNAPYALDLLDFFTNETIKDLYSSLIS